MAFRISFGRIAGRTFAANILLLRCGSYILNVATEQRTRRKERYSPSNQAVTALMKAIKQTISQAEEIYITFSFFISSRSFVSS